MKTASKRAIQKTAEATGDLIIKLVIKLQTNNQCFEKTCKEDVEITTHKERCISPEERQQIIDELG